MIIKTHIILLIVIMILKPALAQERADFSVSTIDNKELSLKSHYEQGALLISFWALWCEPCKVEMRVLKSLYDEYKDRGFTIVGINQDSPKSVSKVRSYVSSQSITFPVVLDPNNQYLQKMNGQSIPYTLLYDKTGKLAYKHTGYLPGDEVQLKKEIEKLLSGTM